MTSGDHDDRTGDARDVADSPEGSPPSPSAPASEGHPFVTLLPLVLAAVLVVLVGLGAAVWGGGTTASMPTAAHEPDAVRIPRLQRAAEDLMGARLPGPVAVTRLGTHELEDLVTRLSDDEDDPTLGPGYDDLMHLLGILRPEQHLATVMTEGLVGQAAGVYDPKTDRLYLVKRAGTDATDSTILHEIVHAIQDRTSPLDALMSGAADDADAASAIQAFVEGEATETQTRYLEREGTAAVFGELSTALRQMGGTSFSLPPALQRSLEFPYTQGSQFVAAVRERGGDAAVKRAFLHPPTTTLTILQPERFFDGTDRAVAVPMPSADGARRVLSTTFGAADVWALTGDLRSTLTWRGGRTTVDRRGARATLTLRIHSTDPDDLADHLREALPSSATVTVSGAVVTATNQATLDRGGG